MILTDYIMGQKLEETKSQCGLEVTKSTMTYERIQTKKAVLGSSMKRKNATIESVTLKNQSNSKRNDKINNPNPQLQFPWYNQPIQEPSQNVLTNPFQTRISQEPVKLETADKRMQKITKRCNIIGELQKQTDLLFIDKASDLTQTSEPPDNSTPNGVDDTVKELPRSFIGIGEVRGFQFTQIKCSNSAFLFEVRAFRRKYYEIFERRINSQYGNVSYPSAKAFGVWAWTTSSFEKAQEYFEQINQRKGKALCV